MNALSLGYIAYFMVCLVSVSYSINKAEALFESLRVFAGMCVFLFSCYFFFNPENQRSFLKGISLITFFACLYGIVQLLQLNVYNIENLYAVTSISGHKNLFASILYLLLIFNLAGFLQAKRIWKILSAAGALLCIALILVLQTRAVWLACFVFGALAGGIMIFKYKSQVYKFKKLFYGAVVGFSFIAGFLLGRGTNSAFVSRLNVLNYLHSVTGHERLELWQKTLCFIKTHLLFGVGAGNWQVYFPSCSVSGIWKSEMLNVTFQRPHNDFLWVLSETGIVGFFFYISLTAVFAYLFYKVILQESNRQMLITLVYLSGFFGFVIIAALDFPRERIEHVIFYNCLQGLIAARCILWIPLKLGISINILKYKPVFLVLLCLGIFVGVYRYQGEYFSRRIYSNKAVGNWAATIVNCDKAYSLFYTIDPYSVPIHWYRGVANFSLQKHDEAYFDFETAYGYNPYNHHVLNNLATSYELKGLHQEAKNFYSEAIRINPRFDDPRLNIAVIYFNEKKYKEAYFWALSCKNDSERKTYYLSVIQEKLN